MITTFWRPLTPINNFEQDYHCYWENFLTEEEINFLLARPEWCAATDARIINKQTTSEINEQARRTKTAWLYPEAELEIIWAKLNNVVNEVNRRFFHFDLSGFYEPIQLGIYTQEDSGHYAWHTDEIIKMATTPRKLSMSILLSNPNEFEGGDLQIKTATDEPITLEGKRGRAWFFPSYTLHRVTPVTKGVRRSLVLWVGGPPFR